MPDAHRKPNVVIFFTDDQGTLDSNCYGSTDLFTQNMDRIAAEGVRFTQAYAHTVCCPSRAMLFTGRYPQRSGVVDWTQGNSKDPEKGINMALSEVTLAQALGQAGYSTGLFGKWHLGAHVDHGPLQQGFDEFFGLRGGFIDNYNHHFLHGKGFHDLYDGDEEVFMNGEYFPDLMVNRAVGFIERYKDQPFFLYAAFNIPHYPEQADSKFDDRYADLEMPRQSYAKMVSTTDDRMGVLLDKLDELGLREDTIVIFMSDNGHSCEQNSIGVDDHTSGLPKDHYYGAHGGGGNTGKWRGCKGQFFEGGIRVPTVISYQKELPSNVVRDQTITACDWFPTILDLCEVECPDAVLDGQSLRPILATEEAPSHHDELHWQWSDRWAVLKDTWKLIGKGDEAEFLASLEGDNPEGKNCIVTHHDIARQLHRLHDDWRKNVDVQHKGQ